MGNETFCTKVELRWPCHGSSGNSDGIP